MQWNLTSFLFLIGAWLVGYATGLIEMHARRAREIKRLKEELARKEAALQENIAPLPPESALRLWFDEQQNLQLEIDGLALSTPEQVGEPQRKRLIELLNRLRPWLQEGVAQQAPASPGPARAGKPATPPVQTRPVAPPPPASEPRRVSTGGAGIVEQIDAILQQLLRGSALAGRVRLREQEGGGIEIWVDAKHYRSIDEIAEAEVKAAIRAAITEWERRS